MTDLELAYAHCGAITRREARNFYFAFLTLPKAQRRAICVAYAFCRHCDDSVDAQRSVSEKLTMLNELREMLEQAYRGHPPAFASRDGEAGREGVFLALADVAQRHQIPQEHFQEVLSGVQADLVKDRYQNFDELRTYCYQVASAVGLICLQIFGYTDPKARDRAVDLGLAMQLTNIARDVAEDWQMGRVYLPQDEMLRFGYSEAELQAGVVNQAFVELMRFQSQRAREYFRSGLLLLPYLSPRCRPCPAVLGQLYRRVLDHIEAAGYDVLHHRASLSTAEKLWVMAQTWTGAMLPRSPR
ncbi:MAG TPA: phytoene/squalene synthase family protein [Dehalococcoidia bacterium]|nr:phytoene/squalene synthase family protein [Dehalococcoidia bacterium]